MYGCFHYGQCLSGVIGRADLWNFRIATPAGYFIGAHSQDYITEPRIFRQTPVADSNIRCRNIFDNALINHIKILRVTEHSLFFEITHHSVRRFLRDNIKKKIRNIKNSLGGDNQKTFKKSGLFYLDERHQVHAFIFRLVEQGFDPAVIIFHLPQASEMKKASANHAGHGSNGLKNDGAMPIALCKKCVGEKSQEPDKEEGARILKTLWLVMSAGIRHLK